MDANYLEVISLWQPWATWVLWGWKIIETRTHPRFAGLCGKRIGIHAAKRWDDNAFTLAAPYLSSQQIAKTLVFQHAKGELICTAYVTRYSSRLVRTDEKDALIECQTRHRTGIWLDRLAPFSPPIPMIGRQGIWHVPYPIRADSPARIATRNVAGGRPFAGNSSPS